MAYEVRGISINHNEVRTEEVLTVDTGLTLLGVPCDTPVPFGLLRLLSSFGEQLAAELDLPPSQ